MIDITRSQETNVLFHHAAVGQDFYFHWVILSLGLSCVALSAATIASCRSCVNFFNFLFHRNPMKSKSYRVFFKYHAHYWWILGVAVVAHAMMSISHTGIPLPGNPDSDANIHRIILLFALASALSIITVFFSCRIYSKFLASLRPKDSFISTGYTSLYKYHSYLWLVFLGAVAAHMTVAIIHTGLTGV